MAAALEVVIVHSPNAGKDVRVIGGHEPSLHSSCCRHGHAARKRHNATQTTATATATTSTAQVGQLDGSCCCVITTHHHHCHCSSHRQHHHHHHHNSHRSHHCQPHHSHHQHHNHASKRRALLRQPRHRHHHQQQQQQQQLQNHRQSAKHSPRLENQSKLPVNNKSSLDSSEDVLHHQEIAIEIDAATMTEDDDEDGEENNSSTATSNFPYKVASEGVIPIIMAPLREQTRRRRGSLNSNTTIETDELSHDEDDDDDDDDDDVRIGHEHLAEDEAQLQPPANTASSSSTTRAAPASAPARNECVRIKRKRFIPDAGQDCCSSCSSCSCNRGQSSSCSSLDDDMNAHELTVAVECHQCNQQPVVSRRASFCSCQTTSCCCGSCSQEEEVYAGDDDDDDDDDDETTGQRESFCTAADHTIMSTPTHDGEEPHSSTLTPLSTQRSSLMDLAEHTMRSDGAPGTQTDADASSLSQSAEYFSLSSNAGPLQSLAKEADEKKQQESPEPQPQATLPPPGCKHSRKHSRGRQKRCSSPLDSQL